jgi:two-component system nitrate/nitrite response regulator NarL
VKPIKLDDASSAPAQGNAMPAKIQIALLGRNALVREGLRHILSEEQFDVVASSEDPADLLKRSSSALVGHTVVLIDQCTCRYGEDDLAIIKRQYDGVRFVFLSSCLDLEYMIEAFKLGAHGFIINDVGCESLLGSLRLVAVGEKVLPSQLVEILPMMSGVGSCIIKVAEPGSALSDRETEILSCLVIGLPNKLIARRLDLCEATVKVHVKGILRKLGVHNRTQAAIYALNNGLDSTFRMGAEDHIPGGKLNVGQPQMA